MSGGQRAGLLVGLRPAGLVGLAWGAVLLARGPALFERVQGRPPVQGEREALVVLGVRHTGQGLLQVLLPRHLGGLYTVVDGLHAASMVAVAALSPQRRRAALVSGGAATVSGVASLAGRLS